MSIAIIKIMDFAIRKFRYNKTCKEEDAYETSVKSRDN